MAKRLSDIQKKEIIKLFSDGKTIEDLAISFNCTKLTISRNLKKEIGDKKFKEFNNKSKLLNINNESNESNGVKTSLIVDDLGKKIINERFDQEQNVGEAHNQEFKSMSQFMELTPIDYEIDNAIQKDLSSVPISEIDFPKIVYMIVDKKIELQVKYLREFPDWEFLSKEELKRKTIQIYTELKNAKRFCTKDQKVIKVPNPKVFQLVAPLLLSRGVSRIISEDKLIAL